MKPFLMHCALASMLLSSSVYSDTNAPSANLRSFSLSVPSVSASAASTLNAQWEASTTNSPAGYFVSAHAIPALSSNQMPTDANRFLQYNCPSAGFTCGVPQVKSCNFNKKRLSCSFHTGVTLVPGNYSIIARACVFDVSRNSVCSTKESSLVVYP